VLTVGAGGYPGKITEVLSEEAWEIRIANPRNSTTQGTEKTLRFQSLRVYLSVSLCPLWLKGS